MRRALPELGPTAQAAVPGLYAWSVTVVPLVFGRGAPTVARGAASLAALVLLLAPVVELVRPRLARLLTVWGFPAVTALTWLLATPTGSAPPSELPRGLAGMVGWGLFAFAAAAPTPRRDATSEARFLGVTRVSSRGRPLLADRILLAVGIAMAVGFQLAGWRATTPERSLMIRLVATLAGVAAIDAFTNVALMGHGKPQRSLRAVLRPTLGPLLLLVTLLILGLVVPLPR